jgi:hypothetical protein
MLNHLFMHVYFLSGILLMGNMDAVLCTLQVNKELTPILARIRASRLGKYQASGSYHI